MIYVRTRRLAVVASVALGSVALARSAQAQKPPEPTVGAPAQVLIDLAEQAPRRIRLEAGSYLVVLANAVPGRLYWLTVGPSVSFEMPALPVGATAISKPAAADLRPTEDCPAVVPALALAGSQTELQVRRNVEAVRAALASAECPADRGKIEDLVASTSQLMSTAIVVSANSVRQLTISSRAGTRWDVALDSTGRGVWQATYGFAFGPDHDDQFFSQATAESQFTITRQPRQRGSLTFLPSMFWTWLSTDQAFKPFQHGPTVGVGVSTGDSGGRVAVLGGYTLRFNQNVGVIIGLSLYPHKRLDGQFREGQMIKEPLTPDKLNRGVFRANWFFGFTLRLGTNPWGGSKEPEKGR